MNYKELQKLVKSDKYKQSYNNRFKKEKLSKIWEEFILSNIKELEKEWNNFKEMYWETEDWKTYKVEITIY